MEQISVIGSINVDVTYQLDHFPVPGETMLALPPTKSGGGKGANQAVAASRNGILVSLIGVVGVDEFGRFMLERFEQETINTEYLQVNPETPTGQALIFLDASGQNEIIVSSGANLALQANHTAQSVTNLQASQAVIATLESPIPAIIAGFEAAKRMHQLTVLNPAPQQVNLPVELLALTDILIPNEIEVTALSPKLYTDAPQSSAIADFIAEHQLKALIITLGENGVYAQTAAGEEFVLPAIKVRAIDSAAAGDTLIGALLATLNPDLGNLEQALHYGISAAALTVIRAGTQSIIPTANEVQSFLQG